MELSYIFSFFLVIKECLKRDSVDDISQLREHPSILKYLAGKKTDGKLVMKVFLSEDNEKAESVFRKNCNIAEGMEIEFKNVTDISKEMQQKNKNIKDHERKAPPLEKATRTELKHIIQKHENRIYAEYSNVIGIRISKVRYVADKIQYEPCIVLYCLDESLTPFGEKQLPESLEGWPCDIREDYFMFGIQCSNCLSPNIPQPGCSISILSDKHSGSVGFLYETRNTVRSGFLTASHVAVKKCEELYRDKKLMSEHPLRFNPHLIVHPSYHDNNEHDNLVGKVVESFFGNYGTSDDLEDTLEIETKLKCGLDVAVVESNSIPEGMILLRMLKTHSLI